MPAPLAPMKQSHFLDKPRSSSNDTKRPLKQAFAGALAPNTTEDFLANQLR